MTASSGASRILIRTLPIGHGNYGGLLQGYALQNILRSMSSSVTTDLSVRPDLKSRMVTSVVPIKNLVYPQPLFRREINDATNAVPNAFISQHMQTTRLFELSRSKRRRLLASVDTVVVGGDQVWRSEYGDVPSYLLDFLGRNAPQRRITYAASFGKVDHSAQNDLRRFSGLAGMFDAIGVREDWAVPLCRELWNVDAVQVVDPVLLLERKNYEDLIASAASEVNEKDPFSFAFLLDPNEQKISAVRKLSNSASTKVKVFTPSGSPSFRQFRSGEFQASQITIASWLACIRQAQFVVTDSYHGAVLAALFNTPCAVLGNRSRGMGRFESLVRSLGLPSDIRVDPAEYSREIETADWVRVNDRIARARSSSLTWLQNSLYPQSIDRRAGEVDTLAADSLAP